MTKPHRIMLVSVDPLILRRSIGIVLKHHIYVADALQIASATESKANCFVTADKELAGVARKVGLNTLLL